MTSRTRRGSAVVDEGVDGRSRVRLCGGLTVERVLLSDERRRKMRGERREGENGVSTGKDERAKRGAYGDWTILFR